MTNPLINSERVTKIFVDCLFKNDEVVDGKPTSEPVVVDGLTSKFGFHKERLISHKKEVAEMLKGLPDSFHKDGGGGMSFLGMCDDKNGIQWTGFHKVMQELVVLGIGVGLVSYCAPKEMWDILPGGMPYLVVDLEKGEKNEL